MKTIIIDGQEYTRKTDAEENEQYYIVRTESAGVFFAKIKSREGKEAVLIDARRLWYWSGAASLSEIAMKGVFKPEECKFSCPVNKTIVTECIEILECTSEACKCIKKVPIWTAHE